LLGFGFGLQSGINQANHVPLIRGSTVRARQGDFLGLVAKKAPDAVDQEPNRTAHKILNFVGIYVPL
jgi:hypothetical protein